MKIYRISCAALIVSGILFIQLATSGCSSGPGEPAVRPDTTAKKTAQPALYKVEIRQMKFEPSELKVKKGDKVVFVNEDIVTHDVTEAKRRRWTSSPLKTGEYWTLVVTESSDYFCSLHPVMKGRIIVE
ncbi:MAG: plastocyanin/azurin family copper-binding protein [Bacteroidota bacterium]